MFLILGLGNPGPRYETTRHNAGFIVVDNLAEKHRIKFSHNKYRCRYGQGDVCGVEVMVAKPMTYMNESGKSAKAILSDLKITPDRIIVVHDDIDLPLGKVKIKSKGGDGGQRGLRSIAETLRTKEFHRVRIGVGRPEHQDEIVDYVLSSFEDEEVQQFNDVIEQAVGLIESTLSELSNRTL